MTPLMVLWFVFGLATAGLALYRKIVSLKEEDYLHLGSGEEGQISEQVAMDRRLSAIDTWGKGLTVATVVLGLAVAGIYLLQAWQVNSQPFH